MALAFKAGCSLLLSFHFHCECFSEFTVNSNGISFVREAAFYHFSPGWSRGVSTWHFPNWRLAPPRFALTSPVSLAFPQRSPVGAGGVAAPHLSRSLSLDQSKALLTSLRLRFAGCHIHSRLASASQWLRAFYCVDATGCSGAIGASLQPAQRFSVSLIPATQPLGVPDDKLPSPCSQGQGMGRTN